jgi:hypothetical protein
MADRRAWAGAGARSAVEPRRRADEEARQTLARHAIAFARVGGTAQRGTGARTRRGAIGPRAASGQATVVLAKRLTNSRRLMAILRMRTTPYHIVERKPCCGASQQNRSLGCVSQTLRGSRICSKRERVRFPAGLEFTVGQARRELSSVGRTARSDRRDDLIARPLAEAGLIVGRLLACVALERKVECGTD